MIGFSLLIGVLLLVSTRSGSTVVAQAQGEYLEIHVISEDLSTPTPTIIPTSTQTITATQVISPTPTLTATPLLTAEPVEILPIPASTQADEAFNDVQSPADSWLYVYLPFISAYRIPTTTRLFCSQGSPISIPDNNSNGIVSNLTIDQAGIILDVNVYLKINHAWPGDLKAILIQQGSGIGIDLIDRPGVPASGLGCGNDHIQSILDDASSQPAEIKCGAYPAAIAGIFQPAEPLNQFNRQWTSGNWKLEISDLAAYDTGSLQNWCLEITSGDPSVTPTPTPAPVSLPASASVSGVTGQNQALSLDCESRTAVDWAKFFGVTIPELEFFNRLPHSDNPEKGFVGNVNGAWGKIPPDDYGVHAAPVAALLRDYGLTARADHSLRWDDIRSEIASGNPVMVWITGSTYAGRYPSGAPQFYTSISDQNFTMVANYEHTVIVTGYNSTTVYIRDGASTYTRSLVEFLDSWSALRNMAIRARP